MPEATPTSAIPRPIGYDEDTLANYYKSMTVPIDQQTAFNRGKARTDAAASGLEGTATETGGVAAAQAYGDQLKSSTLSNLAFNMAGLSNQDALIKQQQDWQSNESKLGRDWQSYQNQLERDYGLNKMATQNRYNYQGAIAGLGARVGGAVIGGLL